MGVPTIDTGPITVADFYAFTDRRPDEEKWELIDGELILNVEAVVFARDNGFAEQRLRLLTDAIEFPALGVTLPLSDIYDDIEFARSP
jgi:hypothetical protein